MLLAVFTFSFYAVNLKTTDWELIASVNSIMGKI